MNITFECMPCFVRHTLDVLKEFSDDEKVNEVVLRRVLAQMSELDYQISPPEFAAEVHSFIRQQLDCEDPYAEIKRNSNELASGLVEKLAPKIDGSGSPLRSAVLYAIAGNIIDSGVSAVTPFEEIAASIAMAENEKPAIDDFLALENAIEKAERILILGDNAGEIYFDRLLLKALPPGKVLTYAVKRGAILNDATFEDADAAGIDEFAEVVDNGTRFPGTPLKHVSDEFRKVFAEADLIIAKGQANFETLSNRCDPRVFFLLRAKCDVIARKIAVPMGSFVILCNQTAIV